jgi:hypothetical protein
MSSRFAFRPLAAEVPSAMSRFRITHGIGVLLWHHADVKLPYAKERSATV